MELFGVKFAPLNVPLERRLQTLSAAAWFIVLAFGDVLGWLLTIFLFLYTGTFRYLVLLYLVWVYYDRDTSNCGGRRAVRWLQSCGWMRYFCAYFPLKLVKTTDLDPTRNYLFCSFPHGILSTGVFGAFATTCLGFEDKFPGLEPRVIVLEQHFKIPFFREYVLSMGGCSSSARSINNLLSSKANNPYEGRAVVLIVGGASESLESKPGKYRVLVKRRKGFVKIALKNGTPLVPVLSFGETDIYDQYYAPVGSYVRKVQDYIRRIVGLAPIIILGRGFFQYTFGLIAQRRPVTVVVGKPVEVPKIAEPTEEQIDEVHEKFTKSLIELFESNKHKYVKDAESTILETDL
ncbi:hypothetical protein KPH14_007388 [Odynerus spinipes]|uniref:Acyltransferase n=1 Tax=Odynerus spinipes TaxID=1348599 RepID=A0AAD9RAD7_9HYME|nr:hypothetical protein KPH14_007388 [Odynerus spinipes]